MDLPCTQDDDCADGRLDCTGYRCDGDECVFDVYPNVCLIDGVCVFDGETSPVDACAVCTSGSSAGAWTERDCGDENPCTSDTCDADTGCVNANLDGIPCDDGSPCDDLAMCDQGSCKGAGCECLLDSDCAPPADPCFAVKCLGFHCVPAALTTDAGSCDDGDACTVDDRCVAGTCGGVPKVCDDDGSPCQPSVCDSATGDCLPAGLAPGAPCDDGVACTIDDACDDQGGCAGQTVDCTLFETPCLAAACGTAGTCTTTPRGPAVECDDGQACTVDDVCSNGVCAGTWLGLVEECKCSDNASCDDGLSCTVDVCSGGACSYTIKPTSCLIDGACYATHAERPTNPCQICDPKAGAGAWQLRQCLDGNACTGDRCDPSVGCVFDALDGKPCDDGDACSIDDHCEAAACVGTCECLDDPDCQDLAAPACSAMVCQSHSCVAVPDPALNGSACDDGRACTGADTCSAGVCAGGALLDCSGFDGTCTQGRCEELVGGCISQPVNAGASCEDGDPCTDSDACDGVGGCAGTPRDCSEHANACAEAACLGGLCKQSPRPAGTACDDGETCTTQDQCDGAGACAGAWSASPQCQCQGDADCSSLVGTCRKAHCDGGVCILDVLSSGEPCDDGQACTRNDACGPSGSCAGFGYTCADDVSCTANVCDGLGGCTFPVEPGQCLIGGQCYSAGAQPQAAPCLACSPAENALGWSHLSDGAACEMSGGCGAVGACHAGLCQAPPMNCEDGLACTTDGCTGGACSNAVQAGWCVINAACVAAGTKRPGHVCQACVPQLSNDGWSDATGGCDDGDPCTYDDLCDSGDCKGQASGCSEDERPCTLAQCDGVGGCDYVPSGDGCFIGGLCYPQGAAPPESPCLVCDVMRDVDEWSVATSGSTCDDGLECTTESLCNATGQCVGAPTCEALSCETALCNPDGTCSVALRPDFCRIDDACYVDGAVNPDNPCQGCLSGADPTGWTDLAVTCDHVDPCVTHATCSEGECTPATLLICANQGACRVATCGPNGQCQHSTQPDSCFIGGACYAEGAVNPGNPCQECQPEASQSSWTSRTGACTDDGLGCTTDLCVGATCVHEWSSASGQCFIGNKCEAVGTLSPDESCMHCDPATSGTSWSQRTNGASCEGDGQSCTLDECLGGTCRHAPIDDFEGCDDGDSTTSPDWCWSGRCAGWSREVPGQGGAYYAAAPDGTGSVHALWKGDDESAGDLGPGGVDRFSGELTATGTFLLEGSDARVTTTKLIDSGTVYSWTTFDGWAPDAGLTQGWAAVPGDAEVGALVESTEASDSALAAAIWSSEGDGASVWWCQIGPAGGAPCGVDVFGQGTQLTNCVGLAAAAGQRFVTCEVAGGLAFTNVRTYRQDANGHWAQWSNRLVSVTRHLVAATSANNDLIWAGTGGLLRVQPVKTSGEPGQDAQVAPEFLSGVDTTFTAVTTHYNRAWALAQRDEIAGRVIYLVSASLNTTLNQPSNWRGDMVVEVGLGLSDVDNPGPHAMAGFGGGLYLFGRWSAAGAFTSSRAVWRWAPLTVAAPPTGRPPP